MNADFRDFDKRFYTEMSVAPLGLTTIGTIHERRKTKYNRLKRLNEGKDNLFYTNLAFRKEIFRLISILGLSPNLHKRVYYNALKFRKKMVFNTYNRGPAFLVPVSIYITCLQEFVFIPLKKLLNYIKFGRKNFFICLKEVFRAFPPLYQNIMSKEFRMKTIRVQLRGLSNHCNLPREFMKTSTDLLDVHYEALKNAKLPSITGRIFRLVKKEFLYIKCTLTKACEFLGIAESTVSYREKNDVY